MNQTPAENPFTEDYFMRGKETGVSNYQNYVWLGATTIKCAQVIAAYMDMRRGDTVLDYGCSRGYYVRAFREIGYRAFGYDISKWAIENCDPEVKGMVWNEPPESAVDWIIMKDVAEHIPLNQISGVMAKVAQLAHRGVLIIVPLTYVRDQPYIREEDNLDKTHVVRWTLLDWMSFLDKFFPGFIISVSYHIPDIKPASKEVPHSTGYFKITRE